MNGGDEHSFLDLDCLDVCVCMNTRTKQGDVGIGGQCDVNGCLDWDICCRSLMGI